MDTNKNSNIQETEIIQSNPEVQEIETKTNRNHASKKIAIILTFTLVLVLLVCALGYLYLNKNNQDIFDGTTISQPKEEEIKSEDIEDTDDKDLDSKPTEATENTPLPTETNKPAYTTKQMTININPIYNKINNNSLATFQFTLQVPQDANVSKINVLEDEPYDRGIKIEGTDFSLEIRQIYEALPGLFKDAKEIVELTTRLETHNSKIYRASYTDRPNYHEYFTDYRPTKEECTKLFNGEDGYPCGISPVPVKNGILIIECTANSENVSTCDEIVKRTELKISE